MVDPAGVLSRLWATGQTGRTLAEKTLATFAVGARPAVFPSFGEWLRMAQPERTLSAYLGLQGKGRGKRVRTLRVSQRFPERRVVSGSVCGEGGLRGGQPLVGCGSTSALRTHGCVRHRLATEPHTLASWRPGPCVRAASARQEKGQTGGLERRVLCRPTSSDRADKPPLGQRVAGSGEKSIDKTAGPVKSC